MNAKSDGDGTTTSLRRSQQDFQIIGTTQARVEGMAKAMGRLEYLGDMHVHEMLWAKLLRSTHPHARIKRLDLTPALRLPGVVAVITGKDLPISYGIMPSGQDEYGLVQEKVRFVGDPIAAVAAVDEETAQAACELIEVEYDPLPICMSIQDAVTYSGEPIQSPSSRTSIGNVSKAVSLEFGDTEAGFSRAEYIREDLFDYHGNTHLALEEHGALAVPENKEGLVVYSGTQNPHYVHKALAKVLQLPAGHIRMVAKLVGGGFGGKCDPFHHEMAVSKLALVTGKPVKIILTREEVFYVHRGRHPVLMWVKTGFRRDGTITAQHWKTFLDGGAHTSYGVASTYYTGATQPTTYKLPAYKFEGMRVFTNKPPCGPKRGHGNTQPRCALEVHMDKAAADLGIDPVSLRLRNLIEPFSRTVNHLRITSCGLKEALERAVAASGFGEKHGRLPYGKGVGLAVSGFLTGAGLPIYWNRMDHSQAWVRAERGGGVTIFCGATEIGQGTLTVHVALVAEVLGVGAAEITVVHADSAAAPLDLGSYGSRVTFMSGNAVLAAARDLRRMLCNAVLEKLKAPADQADRLEFRDGRIFFRDDKDWSISFQEACELGETKYGNLLATGSYRPPENLLGASFKGSGVGPSPAYSYSAAVVMVDVDPESGEYKVEKVWLAHDIGRTLSPLMAIGQVEGSVYMGLSEAMMEDWVFVKGLLKQPSLLSNKSLTFLDMPPVETILVESLDPEGPFGAKEVGQGPLLPVPPALANAIFDAVGVRIDETPITPDKILKALDLKAAGKPGRVGPMALPDYRFPDPIRVPTPWETHELVGEGSK